jgi:hypothetical protein
MTNKEIIQILKSKPKKSQSCVPLSKTLIKIYRENQTGFVFEQTEAYSLTPSIFLPSLY